MPNLKGDIYPKIKLRINSYKLTNEGYALLNLVERVKGEGKQREEQKKQQEQPKQSTRS